MREHLKNLIKGKCVALVGPADSIARMGLGGRIDNHDIIVRMNRNFRNLQNQNDKGYRIDVLYSCFWPSEKGGVGRAACDPNLLGAEKIKHYVGIHYPSGRSSFTVNQAIMGLRSRGHQASIACGKVDKKCREACGGKPNTGLATIFDLLSLKPQSLSVYGLSFFQTGYDNGYRPSAGNLSQIKKDHAKSSHANSEKQFQAFCDLVAANNQIQLDPYLQKQIKGNSNA